MIEVDLADAEIHPGESGDTAIVRGTDLTRGYTKSCGCLRKKASSERTAKVMRERYPEEMVERAVKGMLPHNRLGRQMAKKLFVYAGATHKHEAQKPVALEVK